MAGDRRHPAWNVSLMVIRRALAPPGGTGSIPPRRRCPGRTSQLKSQPIRPVTRCIGHEAGHLFGPPASRADLPPPFRARIMSLPR